MPSLLPRQVTFTKNIAKLINYIGSVGYSCTFGDAYRTPEQAKANAAAGKGIAQSLHCVRLAVDLNLFDENNKYLTEPNNQYTEIGRYWESLNVDNRWGGFFVLKYHGRLSDANHFEMKDI